MADNFEDLGVKFGSSEEKFWTDLKTRTEEAKLNNIREQIINDEILKLCESKIAEEKEKFK